MSGSSISAHRAKFNKNHVCRDDIDELLEKYKASVTTDYSVIDMKQRRADCRRKYILYKAAKALKENEHAQEREGQRECETKNTHGSCDEADRWWAIFGESERGTETCASLVARIAHMKLS